MNLRVRLIVAFFLLSVLPLGVVTLYTYTSSAKAMQDAAQHEAQLLADELTQRMQTVTAQLSDRMAHLMDLSAAAATPAAPAAPTAGSARATTATAKTTTTETDRAAEALGDVAMLLNNIEVRNAGFGRGGRRGGGPGGGGQNDRGGGPGNPNDRGGGGADRGGGGSGFRGAFSGQFPSAGQGSQPPGAPSAGSTTPAAPGSPSNAGGQGPRFFPPDRNFPQRAAPGSGASDQSRGTTTPPGVPPSGPTAPPSPATASAPAAPVAPVAPGGQTRPAPTGAGPGAAPPRAPAPAAADANAGDLGRIQIDLMPIRQAMFQELAPQGLDKLSPDERTRIFNEVQLRMLGIAQGIQVGAAELQKKVAAAQEAANTKAREIANQKRAEASAAASVSAPSSTATPDTSAATQRQTAVSGSHIDVTVMRNGEVVHTAGAEINLPNLLATVFSRVQRDRGEVPFAVAKDGQLYAPSDADRETIRGIGGDIAKPETPPGTVQTAAWVVVTIQDPTGSGLKFGIARPVGDALGALRRTTARNAGFGLAFIGLAIIGIVPLSSRLTRNLSKLSDGVRRIAQGDYHARVEVRSQDEIGKLATAFNQMAADVEEHQRSAIEQERIKRELELGRQIQHDMLPASPQHFGLTEVQGVSVPAREVGGDFFNYFELSNGQIALLVGDVSGKGVGAALLMANIQASLRTRLALGQDLAAIAHEIDQDVEANTPGPVYATLFVGILDPVTRVIRYFNAGHHPQYALRRGDGIVRMPSTGLPVGLLAGRGYTEASVQLGQGDVIFFYTDGCVEAESESGDMFGAERLEALLGRAAAEATEDVLARVEREVSLFRGSRELFDDATMMAVKVG